MSSRSLSWTSLKSKSVFYSLKKFDNPVSFTTEFYISCEVSQTTLKKFFECVSIKERK